MRAIKAVLFDLDGTLIDTIQDLANASNYTMEQLGYPTYDVQSYKYRVGNGIPKLLERALPEGHRTAEEVNRALDIFMPYYNAHALDNTVAYEGMHELVDWLQQRGIKTAVVTNKAQQSAELVIGRLYPERFDVIIGQRKGMPAKPDPTAALLAMSELSVTPEQCIFIGDSGVDVLTAANSGAYPVGVLWGFREREELVENGAAAIISSPEQLKPLVDNAPIV